MRRGTTMLRTAGVPAACAGLAIASAAASPAALASAPVPAPAAQPPAGAPGRVILSLPRVGGTPLFATAGRRITIEGVVWPYVGGQRVKVSVYREGRKVLVARERVRAVGNGSGTFRVPYQSNSEGLVKARVVHYATAQQAQFTGRTPDVRYVHTSLGPGASGASVRLLQSELNVLHYAVPLSGVFDEGTGRALIAFRKVVGLARDAYSGGEVFARLARGEGSFHVRYPHDGRHVEGDLTRQVLAEIDAGGRVRTIYTMSSGKPSTPTVIGRFRVYLKTAGVNSEGMVDSNYFIRGYAIHGYPEVPTYAASHGCLRIPIPDAPAVYAWVREGTPVDVYNEGGGGSHSVRGNAGP